MATIAEQLTSLANTKTAIKDAIVAKGVAIADIDPFSAYPAKIGQISGGGAPATKYGVSIDNILGDVDADGSYKSPAGDFVLDLTGVKSIKRSDDNSNKGFNSLFYNEDRCVAVIGNDLIDSNLRDCFYNVCALDTRLSVFEFNSIETIVAQSMFGACNNYGNSKLVPHFNKLKSIKSYSATFDSAFSSAKIEPDETFPSLEYVSGTMQFNNFRKLSEGDVVVFSRIRTIVGATSAYSSTFGSIYTKNLIWKFPNATEFTGYIWYISTSYPGEIHFAAANQAALEACDGYANKWGNAGATIYFDLMLSITVDGVVYSRKHTIGGYTSWESDSGGIVYTNATSEPAVDTPVYSDAGTTQVGTVSGVA